MQNPAPPAQPSALGKEGEGLGEGLLAYNPDTMSSIFDQQPIGRVVGRRRSRDGQPLTADDRARATQMAQYRTRAPKGVFIYSSHEEMEADRMRWLVDAMVERARTNEIKSR